MKSESMADYTVDVSWLLSQEIEDRCIEWDDLPNDLLQYADVPPY
jgi:hypothetical protein